MKWSDRDAWGLSEKVIQDKSKADGLVKLAALCQVVWFCLQCTARAAHGLAHAPLEAMTLAYVFVMVPTYLFWWVKPKDIITPSIVDLPQMTDDQRRIFESLAMENTYDDIDGVRPSRSIAWYLVARDCNDEGSANDIGNGAADRIDIMHNAKAKVETIVTETAVESDEVITEWDASLYFSKWWPLICILGASFGAFHMISWNSTFPTALERWIWRANAVVSVVTSIVSMQFRTVSFRWDGPLTIIRVSSPILYVISRFMMMGEVFAALRAMPESTYETYEIWNYWFHFS